MTLELNQALARTANKAYRTGDEIMSDAEYDLLLADIKKEMGFIPFTEFLETLGEEAGDTSMGNYVLGSLLKLKCGEGELTPWMKKNNIKSVFASEKIDGCSFAASYRNRKLTLCISKGDSNDGTDWTDKALLVLPTTINYDGDLDIRGEFTLTGDSYTKLGYVTRRNGTVGIFNKKAVQPEKLKYVKAIAYQILSDENMNIMNQFVVLQDLGFQTPKNKWFHLSEEFDIIEERLKCKHDEWKATSDYDIDGIVISEPDWVNENQFFPDAKVAFKVNSEGVPAKVVDVEWELSKNRLYNPVVILEPTVINGTTITRATGNNARYILENKIKKGVWVSLIRSGEVIPKVIKVYGENYTPFDSNTQPNPL